jgi:hypothetical protein
MEKIKPGIVVKDYYGNETTIYPTGIEWLFAFAFKGCDWAIKQLESLEPHRYDAEIWKGDGI